MFLVIARERDYETSTNIVGAYATQEAAENAIVDKFHDVKATIQDGNTSIYEWNCGAFEKDQLLGSMHYRGTFFEEDEDGFTSTCKMHIAMLHMKIS